jgi:hypothetical protein
MLDDLNSDLTDHTGADPAFDLVDCRRAAAVRRRRRRKEPRHG